MNSSWKDLWLNEGFTTYLTYRIMELIYGNDRSNMEAVLGREDLQDDIDTLSPEETGLSIDKTNRDPDDVFSNIPYEKGALFLRELEMAVGREAFDTFLKKYFQDFAFKSLDSETFIDYLNNQLILKHPDKINLARINQVYHNRLLLLCPMLLSISIRPEKPG